MRKFLLRSCIALLCAPALAHAQATYKCKQPSGTVSFQDQPCQAGAIGSTVALPPAGADTSRVAEPSKGATKAGRSHPAVADPTWQEKEADFQRRRAEEEVRAHNEKVAAYNKSLRCNQARQQLGVAKEGGAIFSRDNQGNRNYVDDKDRAAVIARTERTVAAECH